MRKTAAVMLVALGAFALGACGDDDDDNGAGGGGGDVSEEERPYVEALAASMQSGDEGDLTLTEEQANCLAPRWVSTIGVDQMREAGIEPEDIGDEGGSDVVSDIGLTQEQGEGLYDAFGACDVDIKAEFIDSLAADDNLTQEDRDCLAENFDDDLLRQIMVTTLVEGDDALENNQELVGDLFAVFSACPGAVD